MKAKKKIGKIKNNKNGIKTTEVELYLGFLGSPGCSNKMSPNFTLVHRLIYVLLNGAFVHPRTHTATVRPYRLLYIVQLSKLYKNSNSGDTSHTQIMSMHLFFYFPFRFRLFIRGYTYYFIYIPSLSPDNSFNWAKHRSEWDNWAKINYPPQRSVLIYGNGAYYYVNNLQN